MSSSELNAIYFPVKFGDFSANYGVLIDPCSDGFRCRVYRPNNLGGAIRVCASEKSVSFTDICAAILACLECIYRREAFFNISHRI